ncbi:hypothetical protein N9B34_01575 [Akkermansiaceae bacterium]|jgi:hypothetical protein|nr:hypothetical protein [Akkermansiaceae bacterium]MDA8977285.1 hypothetical protein [Akkermansiaceae bacterium]MDB4519285.1 hypothetical protein [Akkermansiaceae bacterium]|tara:strand:+ start:549 stop:842 length:294 start_codon:yes stop_codon:yes gene_type:complete
MTTADLARSAQTDDSPPAGITSAQKALWLVKAGRWHDSHELCNDIPGTAGSWIHAYLHREEGDLGNASYWYHRAEKDIPSQNLSLEDEWAQITSALS